MTADDADILVTQFDQRTKVRLGQTIGIKPMRDGTRWQVSYSSDHLRLLTPSDRIETPGPGGWVWRTVGEGDTDIVFTMVPECPRPPCGPNVMQMTAPLEVTK